MQLTDCKQFVIKTVLWLPVFAGVPVHSADWEGPDFEYYADGEQLRELLSSFASSYGLPIFISDKVTDKVNGHLEKRKPQDFLDYIARVYNLTWYYDGAALYIYKNNEIRSEIIALNFLSSESLRSSLLATGIWDSRFYWRSIHEKSLIYIAGPPRYVDLVLKTAKVLEQQLSAQQKDDLFVEIIPLQYVSAMDRIVNFRDQKIEIPGVASVLNEIFTSLEGAENAPAAIAVNDESRSKKKKRGADNAAPANVASVRHGQSMVMAAPSSNAIIVRDSRSRIPLYRRMISYLDKPQRGVELGVSIIDISAEDLDQLGVDWRAGFDVKGNTFVDIATSGNQDSAGLNLGNGDQFSAILNQNSNDYFLARIRLLETRGAAQIVSRPTLLTQENITAILDHNTTFFVKLEGQEEVGLEQVEFGTLIHMLPRVHVVDGDPDIYINLSLHIEDGNQIQDGDVGGLPSVQQTILDTETRVKQGQSVLIGGIYQDRIEKSERRVPLLGSMPVIGTLFRSNNTRVRKTVRMFLIEPRIIDSSVTASSPTQNLGFGRSVDIQQQLAGARAFSNHALPMDDLAALTKCGTKRSGQQLLERLQRRGYGGSLVACEMSTGTNGWRPLLCQAGVKTCLISEKGQLEN